MIPCQRDKADCSCPVIQLVCKQTPLLGVGYNPRGFTGMCVVIFRACSQPTLDRAMGQTCCAPPSNLVVLIGRFLQCGFPFGAYENHLEAAELMAVAKS